MTQLPQLIVTQGPIDPEMALRLVNEYFAEKSEAEIYNDVKEVAPELIEYLGIPDPSAQK